MNSDLRDLEAFGLAFVLGAIALLTVLGLGYFVAMGFVKLSHLVWGVV